MNMTANVDLFSNLAPALSQIFVVIILGYVLGRLDIFPAEESYKYIGKYVGFVALPALLFQSLATLNLHSINWQFFNAVLIGKCLLFFITLAITTALHRKNYMRGGSLGSIYGIFMTQSNDFAIGLAIFNAIYAKTHPEYPSFIFVVAPINVLVINPIGFILMELGRPKPKEEEISHISDNRSMDPILSPVVNPQEIIKKKKDSKNKIINVLIGVATNPIVLCCFLGIIYNVIFGNTLPRVINFPLTAISQTFNGVALFALGLGMCGKLKSISGRQLLLPLLLIFGKSIMLSIFVREALVMLGASSDLKTCGFIYGITPTAASVPVFAYAFEANPDVIGPSMVLGTFISAPIMLISSALVLISSSSHSTDVNILMTVNDVGHVGLLCIVITLYLLYTSKHRVNENVRYYQRLLIVPIYMIFVLNLSSSFCSVGHSSIVTSIRFFILYFHAVGYRIFSSLLLLVTAFSIRRQRRVSILYINLIGFICTTILTILTIFLGDKMSGDDYVECYFLYGNAQVYIIGVILFISLMVCILGLVLIFQIFNFNDTTYQMGEPLLDIQYQELNDKETVYEQFHSFLTRLTFACIFMTISAITGVFLCLWSIFEGNNKMIDGVHLEIRYLDAVLLSGTGILFFVCFGLQEHCIVELKEQLQTLKIWWQQSCLSSPLLKAAHRTSYTPATPKQRDSTVTNAIQQSDPKQMFLF